jgi:hypothetical protein
MNRYLIGSAIVLALSFTIVGVANIAFSRQVKLETERLISYASNEEKDLITDTSLDKIPAIVKMWLLDANVVGKRPIKIARVNQSGMMKLAEDKSWMDYIATQVFTADQPGFLWRVKVKMNPLLTFSGKDTLINEKGNMLIKVLGVIPVVDESGEEIDQGSMIRYLAEMIWLPTAALSDNMTWESIDELSARGILTIGEKQVSADFHFNGKGEIVEIFADRMMDQSGSYSLEKWHIKIDAYDEWGGFRVPSEARVMWELEEGTFEWLSVQIKDVQYE